MINENNPIAVVSPNEYINIHEFCQGFGLSSAIYLETVVCGTRISIAFNAPQGGAIEVVSAQGLKENEDFYKTHCMYYPVRDDNKHPGQVLMGADRHIIYLANRFTPGFVSGAKFIKVCYLTGTFNTKGFSWNTNWDRQMATMFFENLKEMALD